MRGGEFDELRFFEAIQNSRARALLIGRRALVLIGLPRAGTLRHDPDSLPHR
jgi:hypothetical protein